MSARCQRNSDQDGRTVANCDQVPTGNAAGQGRYGQPRPTTATPVSLTCKEDVRGSNPRPGSEKTPRTRDDRPLHGDCQCFVSVNRPGPDPWHPACPTTARPAAHEVPVSCRHAVLEPPSPGWQSLSFVSRGQSPSSFISMSPHQAHRGSSGTPPSRGHHASIART